MRKLVLYALLSFISCKNDVTSPVQKSRKSTATVQKTETKEVAADFSEGYDFLEKLIRDDIDEQQYEELQIKKMPFSVHYPNDGDPYTVAFSIVQRTDLNQDGIMDYIVDRTSEGMLGGNANSNQQLLFYIMKDRLNPKEEHTLYGYAPFSYNVIDDYEFKNNKLEVKVSQNFRVYNAEELDSTKPTFVYQNNNMYEASYLTNCKLAQLKSKSIFKAIPKGIKRKRTIEGHNYTEVFSESYTQNDTLITAELSGCDNLLLTFESTFKVEEGKWEDEKFKKAAALQLLTFLSKNTLFNKELTFVTNYCKEHPLTEDYIELKNGYKFRVLVDQNVDRFREMRILINIDKITNPNQIENWEIVTRKK
ncbi:hypothetical protein [Flavobacterium sp. GCM10023249]|uniref:hypothetical protein n=1 Tax=unclassified Flavobacterium TaxID=196869 RepID=UPI003610EBC8